MASNLIIWPYQSWCLFFFSPAFDKKDVLLTEDEREQYHIVKKKMLGNIKFIGKNSIELVRKIHYQNGDMYCHHFNIFYHFLEIVLFQGLISLIISGLPDFRQLTEIS